MRLHPNWRLLAVILAVVVGPPVAAVALMAKVPPVVTPLMILRTLGYQATSKLPAPHGWAYQWVPLTRIAPSLARAVIAAEDTTFCSHNGFDPEAYNRAWENYSEGIVARGGSTITQQTAKNVFLWPGRSVLRKGVETLLTPLLEAIWGKRRIMEVYLNVVEWAPGIYGAEAAARFHFHHGANELSPREAALLAAVLPSPRHWSASAPGPYVESRVGTIMARESEVTTGCVGR
ncbi:MAG: monofunctional biosynthetic peptidoglycan transglycosylase [Rhodospirillaceae bacterium]|nr:MAG: monofunctional biosynthetic peptidoglycan transglycosylase [Rhodospirillaceae bacterium]